MAEIFVDDGELPDMDTAELLLQIFCNTAINEQTNERIQGTTCKDWH